MAADEKWYFTKERLETTPSRRCGFDADKELSYRQQAANFIQDMGQRLVVSQLCINTAIVYMHRFYVFHSLTSFHRNAIAAAALFLAAKVEEQPRKLEHVIKVAHLCLHREQPALDIKSEQYLEQAQDLVFNENVLLQTLGFDVAIDHPHTHVVRCCQLVKASKDLAQTSYFMASNSLHLTTMCLQYKPTVVACFCIHLACKWSNWEIPQSNEGKHWFWYVDRTVTTEQLEQLTNEFLHIFHRCPSRLKRKIRSISANQSPNMSHPSLPSSPFDMEPRKIQSPVPGMDGGPTFQSNRLHHQERTEDKKSSTSTSGRMPVDYREYREKKERLDREKAAAAVQGHSHHHKPVPAANQIQGKHPGAPMTGQKPPHPHHNHHHNRPDIKPGIQITGSQNPTSSRHSVNSQQRESAASRQRLTREYNSSSGTSGGTVFTHGQGNQSLENTQGTVSAGGGSSSIIDTVLGRGNEQGNLQNETVTHNLQDKQGNNNSHGVTAHTAHHSVENKHLQQQLTTSDNKRQYDPARHKPPEHRKEDSQKLYGKYAAETATRIDRQRKQPDILEQRSEEVRKLIEKPLPLSLTTQKSRQEIQKDEYAANMIKQSSHHHQKYGQEKLQGNPVVVLNQIKTGFNTREKSPANLNPVQQQIIVSKSNKNIQAQYSAHHGASQINKDNVRNGNAPITAPLITPMNINIEDIKTEKKPRPEELERMTASYLATHQTPPGGKHRSLFSPEKTIGIARESGHSQRGKPKQKTPPSAIRNVKQEPIAIKQPPIDLVSPFASPPAAGNHPQEYTASFKRTVNEVAPSSTSSSHKRHRVSSVCEPEQQTLRVKVEDPAGLDSMKMLGRVPELIQPIRDNPTSSNGKNPSVANDLKPPELIKPFEPEPLLLQGTNPSLIMQQGATIIQQNLSNGYDLSRLSSGGAQETQDVRYSSHDKREPQQGLAEHPEYLSPLKSARGISALLQETPVAPLPSLLQQQQIQQIQQQQQQQQQQHQQSGQINIPHSATSIERIGEVPAGASATVQIPAIATPLAVVEDKKSSEHHKSEKKKKKDKHKHKDKDKGKEERKHKHKHKDREKDRHHRDKERGAGDDSVSGVATSAAAVPIRITIPKDKINLGAGGDATSAHQPSEGSSLKIKIPKERLKGGDTTGETQVQAPLKIKIRTGVSLGNNIDVRKRERDNDSGSPTTGGPPPSKKHSQALTTGSSNPGNYIQRTTNAGDRQQNGRHYTTSSSAGNNKEKHSSSSSSSSYYKTSSKSSSSQQHSSSHPT